MHQLPHGDFFHLSSHLQVWDFPFLDGHSASSCSGSRFCPILISNNTRYTPILCWYYYIRITVSCHHLLRWYLSTVVMLSKFFFSPFHTLHIISTCAPVSINYLIYAVSVVTKGNTDPGLSISVHAPLSIIPVSSSTTATGWVPCLVHHSPCSLCTGRILIELT